MRVSREPLAPLRSWKELLLGARVPRPKKSERVRRPESGVLLQTAQVGVGE
jgi:hypothetical protein